MSYISDAVGGWVGWILALPKYVSSASPIPTRGEGQIMSTTLLLAHPDFDKGSYIKNGNPEKFKGQKISKAKYQVLSTSQN